MSRDTRANRLVMNRTNEFIFEGRHVWAPLAQCATKDLEDTLDAVATDCVTVQIHLAGDKKTLARDLRTYARRLATLSARYAVTSLVPKIIDGHIMDSVFVATITRSL